MSGRRDPRLPGFDKARSSAAQGSRAAGTLRYRCFVCGSLERYWTRAERHADTERHHRIELVFS